MEPEVTSNEAVQLSRLAQHLLQDLADVAHTRRESQREQAMQVILDAFYNAYSVLRRGEHQTLNDDECWRLLLDEKNLHEV